MKDNLQDFKLNPQFAYEPNLGQLQAEFASLKQLLSALIDLPGLSFRAIDDVPQNLGIELFLSKNKIAEIYCDEESDQPIAERYLVYSSANDFECREMDLAQCCAHIQALCASPR